jgi:putative alpha-1,2-mannosidase
MGNETCEEAPWVYDFASAPAKTEEVVRRVQRELYTDLPDGLPGNDDAGAMSSWYVFSALGLYPEIPGVAGFAIGSPMFPKAIVHLGNGSTIQIDGRDAAPEDPYVETLQVNGTKYNAPWLPWSSVSNGGRVVFTLVPKASDWGTQISKAPPSFFASVPDAGKQQSSR